jgi:hypothetical protein
MNDSEALAIAAKIDLRTTCRVTIPPVFADDHESRELPTGIRLSENRSGVTYEVNRYEFYEWLSDADYYSDCAGQGWDLGDHSTALGLQSSARATVKRLQRHPNSKLWSDFSNDEGIALYTSYRHSDSNLSG